MFLAIGSFLIRYPTRKERDTAIAATQTNLSAISIWILLRARASKTITGI